MVFEKTLSSVLKNQLRQWVKVRASDVGVGISGGHLVLDNVELRADALNSLALPFKVISGRAGRLRVDVPWIALNSQPVVIYLEDVHISAGKTAVGPQKKRQKSPSSSRLSEQGSEDTDGNHGERRKKKDSEAVPAPPLIALEEDLDDKDRWHESFAFRLAANVSIEVNGFKLEYSDKRCDIALSFTSLRSMACDVGWQPAFVQIDDSSGDPIAIRRTLEMEVLQVQITPKSTEGVSREDFESLFPVLGGLNVRLMLFVCTGGDSAHADSQSVELDRIFGEKESKASSVKSDARRMSRDSSDLNLTKAKQSERRKSAYVKKTNSSAGPIGKLWGYLVGENGYTVEEDAAGVLGLYSDGSEVVLAVDDPFFLTELLENAGNAGGFTWKIRVRTPDVQSRQELKKVKQQLKDERKFREQFTDIEAIISDADAKVKAADDESAILREKNKRLQNELADLEKLISEQNKNKDAIIRQMEAALTKAERHLQLMIQRESYSSPANGPYSKPATPQMSRLQSAPAMKHVSSVPTKLLVAGEMDPGAEALSKSVENLGDGVHLV